MKKINIIFLLIPLVISCTQDKAGNDDLSDAEKNKIKKLVEIGRVFKIADFRLVIPEAWEEEMPESDMRFVQYFVKSVADLKIVGFYFGNQPDMVEENIERWKQEFTKVDDFERMKFADDKITLVTITGTFKKKPFPMAPDFTEEPGYMTIAAIIPSNEGPYFFKLVGQEAQVKNQLINFKLFIKSYEHINSN